SKRLCRGVRGVLSHSRLHTGDSLSLGTVTLSAQLGPLQCAVGTCRLIAVDDPPIDLGPGVATARQLPIFLEHPVSLAHIFLGRRKSTVLRFHHGRVETTTETKAALAGGFGLAESPLRVAHTAS